MPILFQVNINQGLRKEFCEKWADFHFTCWIHEGECKKHHDAPQFVAH